MPTKTITLAAAAATPEPERPSRVDTAEPPDELVTASRRHVMELDRRHVVEVIGRVQRENPTWPSLEQVCIPLAFAFPILIVAVTSDEFEGVMNISANLWKAMFAVAGVAALMVALCLFCRWLVLVRGFKAKTPDEWTDVVCEEQIQDEVKHQEYIAKWRKALEGQE